MPVTHTVAQGEHLSKIASQYGFPDYNVIWNHAENSQLKQSRQNPNVLLTGDQLYIPDKQVGQEQGGTSQRHTFQLDITQLQLHLVLEDVYEKPVSSAPFQLMLDQQPLQGNTDANGHLQHVISPDIEDCSLVLNTEETPVSNNHLVVKVGHLDPVDSPSGQLARLQNLGYRPGTSVKPDSPELVSAVEEFQCDNGIPADGKLGPATQAKLLQVHGC